MIKGIVALFTSGMIFNPFVLLGIVFGFVVALSPNKEGIELLLHLPSFYLLILLLAFFYNYLFKKIYKDDGDKLDILQMFWNIVISFCTFFFSAVLSFIFVLVFLAF